MKLLNCSLCLCLTLFFSCSIAIGQGKDKQTQQDAVQIKCDGNIGQFPIAPIEELLSSLRQHPHENLFRVSWYESAGSWNSNGTALFDKRKQTVTFFCVGGQNLAGNPAVAIHEHYLFTRVCPKEFVEAVHKDKTDRSFGGDPWDADFDQLPKLGCGRRVFRDSWRHQ